MKCEVEGKEVTYDHKLHTGSSRESFGVEMAATLLPDATIQTATALRIVLEANGYQELSPAGREQVKGLISAAD